MTSPESNPSESPEAPGLKPPQFTLRTLMLVISLLALFFAWMPLLPPTVNFLIVLAALTIFAHLAGAHIGSQLRDGADRVRKREPMPQAAMRVETRHFAKPTQLSHRTSLGWPLVVCLAAGVVLGALGGLMLIRLSAPEKASRYDYVFAMLAFAALGGMGAFLVGGFVQTSLYGLLEAIRPVETKPPASTGGSE